MLQPDVTVQGKVRAVVGLQAALAVRKAVGRIRPTTFSAHLTRLAVAVGRRWKAQA